jgi:hypothetical protein
VRVVAVAICRPAEAGPFCRARAPSVTCLCDASMAAYAAYGLVPGTTLQLLSPQTIAAGMRAAFEGHYPQPAPSAAAARVMPGSFAIDATGIVRAVHYARHIGDQPDLRAMLAALATGDA